MLKILYLMLTVSDFGIVIDDECQARYDFSLYMMPHTYSLYLEARNEIFNAKIIRQKH